jgi:hypothetical protein
MPTDIVTDRQLADGTGKDGRNAATKQQQEFVAYLLKLDASRLILVSAMTIRATEAGEGGAAWRLEAALAECSARDIPPGVARALAPALSAEDVWDALTWRKGIRRRRNGGRPRARRQLKPP